MTSRLLLTLLALLTGLSAQGSPVEARALDVQRAEIGAVATVGDGRQSSLAASLLPLVSGRSETAGNAVRPEPVHAVARQAENVRIGIDRARE